MQGAFPGRHDVAQFLHPGVHEFLPGDDLAGLCLHLFPDPGKTTGTGLQVRHPDGVLVSHPQGQVTGSLNGQPVVPVGGVHPQDRLQPVQVLVRVADVLVIRQFRHRRPDHLMGLRRELLPDPVQQCLRVLMHRLSSRAQGLRPFLLLLPLLCAVIAGVKPFQVGLHGHAAFPDYIDEGVPAEGQGAAAGGRTQQYGTDDATRPVGQGIHVEADEAFCILRHGFHDPAGIGAPVARRGFLGDGVVPVGGHQRGGPVRRDQAPQHGAPALDEFTGDDHIHAPGHRHQGQYRRVVPGGIPGEEFQIVHSRPGALGDAGHGGGLRQVAGMLSRPDQPVAEHASTLPAHGQDGDFDGFRLSARRDGGDGLKSVLCRW